MNPNPSDMFRLSLAGILIGLAIWLGVEHRAKLNLAKEHQTLEQQLQQMGDPVARNAQLSNLLARTSAPEASPPAQLLRLRGEVAVLRRQQVDVDVAQQENRNSHAALDRFLQSPANRITAATADYWPREAWTNAGYSSPEAALETVLWAGANGDFKNLLAGVDEEMGKELETQFGGKPEAERSVRLADETYALESARILNREALDNDTMLLTLEMQGRTSVDTVKMVMKRIGSKWVLTRPGE